MIKNTQLMLASVFILALLLDSCSTPQKQNTAAPSIGSSDWKVITKGAASIKIPNDLEHHSLSVVDIIYLNKEGRFAENINFRVEDKSYPKWELDDALKSNKKDIEAFNDSYEILLDKRNEGNDPPYHDLIYSGTFMADSKNFLRIFVQDHIYYALHFAADEKDYEANWPIANAIISSFKIKQ